MKEYRATKKHPFHISCGGIVYKDGGGGVKILLLHRFKSEEWPFDGWHLPKGTKHFDELDSQTVEREVFEETGYQVKVLNEIGSLKSNYILDKNTKANKITHYYLCEPIKKIRNQVEEHSEIKWVELNEAIKLVSSFKIWEREEKILKLLYRERCEAKSPLG